MHLVITGGAGFLGVRLARTLLQQGTLTLAGAAPQTIERLTLIDRVAPPPDLAAHPRVAVVTGDLNALLTPDAQGRTPALPADTQAVVHLAAAVSGECEADIDLGLTSNLDATRALLQACRRLGTQPVFVFSSSLAVYGRTPEQPLPPVIEDDTLPTPQNSYGIQKFMCEQLVADFTRKGFVRGRSVRLMTVSVRPGRPNGAASSFLSGMVREPLAGQRAVCPVPPDTRVALSSPARTVEGLLRALQTGDIDWGPRTALNLPALATTVGEMAAALARVAGAQAAERIDWIPDENITRIIASWPAAMNARRAARLGLQADASYDDVIRAHLRETPQHEHNA
jgi:nucleoside-diphosphate-sugar epimerase